MADGVAEIEAGAPLHEVQAQMLETSIYVVCGLLGSPGVGSLHGECEMNKAASVP
jgi:hypothetical protein